MTSHQAMDVDWQDMDIDSDPPGTQFPGPTSSPTAARVQWSQSNPEMRFLSRQIVLTSTIPHPEPDMLQSPALETYCSRPLPANHPAKAKRYELRDQDSPSAPLHMEKFQSAIGIMKGKVEQNAKKKAVYYQRPRNKSILRQSSALPLRREHTAEAILTSTPDAHASTQDCTTHSQFSTTHHLPDPLSILRSKPMDIDWDYEGMPSSTPTPPPRSHKKRINTADTSSTRKPPTSSSSSSSGASQDFSHPFLSRESSLENDVSMSTPDTASIDISCLDEPVLDDYMSRPLSFEIPSPSVLALPPPRLLSPYQRHGSPMSTQMPAPTHHPPPLARPFATPSQTRPTQSQTTRPRASQYPPPLGMRRPPGQPSTSVNVKKPYKLSITSKVKAPSGLAQPQTTSSQRRESPHEHRPQESLSPAVPDPSHALNTARAPPALEMSARRSDPEPDEYKDANSSADLWACFDE